MENSISSEERYKRAYEMYLKRSNKKPNNNNKKDNNKKLKLVFIQLIASLIIYLSIAGVNSTTSPESSNDILEKVKYIMSYNMDVEATYNQTIDYINNNFTYKLFENEENAIEDNNIVDNTAQQSVVENEIVKSNETLTNTTDNIIVQEEVVENGFVDNTINQEIQAEGGAEEDTSSYSQMEIDANEIKSNYSFIKPLEGTISSRFGIRNPTSPNVPTYHTGIDFAVVVGTEIKAAVAGEVKLVSSQGDYGKHVKVLTGEDIITLYAHCSEIKVKEGDIVQQGQVIALSGNTGNSTGPHLHFEIRKLDRVVNPEYVLQF